MADFNTINEHDNPLLKRKEVTLQVNSESAPTFEDIKQHLAKNSEDNEKIVVKRVNTTFGTNQSTAEVFIYATKQDKDRIETIPRKVREKMEKEAKEKAEQEAKNEEKKAQESQKENAEEKIQDNKQPKQEQAQQENADNKEVKEENN